MGSHYFSTLFSLNPSEITCITCKRVYPRLRTASPHLSSITPRDHGSTLSTEQLYRLVSRIYFIYAATSSNKLPIKAKGTISSTPSPIQTQCLPTAQLPKRNPSSLNVPPQAAPLPPAFPPALYQPPPAQQLPPSPRVPRNPRPLGQRNPILSMARILPQICPPRLFHPNC